MALAPSFYPLESFAWADAHLEIDSIHVGLYSSLGGIKNKHRRKAQTK